MNVNYEIALQYINLGSYDKAVAKLQEAIEGAGAETTEAVQYRCVLAELYSNLGNYEEARTEFERVYDYCMENNVLPKQLEIAKTHLDIFDGRIKSKKDLPGNDLINSVNMKPVQDKAFITSQLRKRHK